MDDLRRDTDQPLAGAPTPWAETDMPTHRDGPPWHMTEMIEAEPALSVRILERLAADGSARRLAQAIGEHADAGRPIVVVGCGTSEHGAMAAATIIGEALDEAGGPTGSMQAFEASLVPMPANGGLVVGISHEGATWATMRALEAARGSGMTTALITVSGRSPAGRLADIVLETGELDRSWCHTVGYLSPIIAAIGVAAGVGGKAVPHEVGATLRAGLQPRSIESTEAIAEALFGLERIVVVAGGTDQIAGRELVLKIEEGTHLPAVFRHVETLLHGHLAGMDEGTGLVAIGAEPRGLAARAARLANGLAAARELGIVAGAIVTPGYAAAIPASLTPAGRIVSDGPVPGVGPAARALLSTTIPLQLLTERMARLRGVNPDPIRRDEPRYLRAAQAASPASPSG